MGSELIDPNLQRRVLSAEPPARELEWKEKKFKYAFLAIAITGVGLALYFAMREPTPTFEINPNPVNSGAVKKFSEDYFRFAKPQYIGTIDGRSVCKIDSSLFSASSCDEGASAMTMIVQAQQNKLYQEVMEGASARSELGFMFGLPTNVPLGDPTFGFLNHVKYSRVTIGENPARILNHKKAVEYLNRHVLRDPQAFFNLPESRILESIRKSHKYLIKGLSPLAGKFRSYEGMVTAERATNGPESYLQFAIDAGGHLKEPRLWESVSRKFRASSINGVLISPMLIPKLDEAERGFVNKYIGTIYPSVDTIATSMESFAAMVKKLGYAVLYKKADPVAAAASIHTKLVEIHPFDDGNGRLSRLWMNVMLLLGGHRDVIIPNDQQYSDAVFNQIKDGNGAMLRYLWEVIRWNQAQAR